MNRPAPIAVFAYKREAHLRRTIASLAANDLAGRSDLHVYCDGPRTPADMAQVMAVRAFARTISGFASVSVHEREGNAGLARSVMAGVDEILNRYDSVVVLEDDLLLSPHFLAYMNQGLDLYAHDPRVASIHGYTYPVREKLPQTFFLRGADCWGWATWRRAWATFRTDGRTLLAELEDRRLAGAFDLDRSFPFTRMLRDQVEGRNDSWAIRWHASCYLQQMLTLYPGRSLVENIGNEGSGTHRLRSAEYSCGPAQEPVQVESIPVAECADARHAFARFLRSTRRRAALRRAGRVLARLFLPRQREAG